MAAARFFECPQRAKSHWVIDRRNQGALCWCATQIFADRIQAVLKLSFSVQVRGRASLDARQDMAETGDSAGNTQLRQRAGDGQLEKQQRFNVSVPVFFCPPS